MSRLRRAAARVTAAVLPALALAIVVPGTAHATAHTFSLHDGTAEDGFAFYPEDGRDWLSEGFFYPDGMIPTVTSATLRIYAQAGGCGPGTSGTQKILTNANVLVTEFDPCAVFPTAGFGWASFSVPVSAFPATSPSWAVKLHPVDLPGEHHTVFAFDLDTEAGGTYAYHYDTATETYTDQPGEAMWELILDGNTPAIAVSPKSLAYGLVEPGTTTAALRVTVTSTGTRDVSSVTSMTFSGPAAADFAVAGDTCTGNPLPYGATCTVDVTFTPTAIGPRSATLTVSIPGGGAAKTVALSGEGRSLPPEATITTPSGTTLFPGDAVTGTATDDIALTNVLVTFRPELPGLATVSSSATLACSSPGSCTWSMSPFALPGRYSVTAYAVDEQGTAGPLTPAISVVVL